MQRRIIPYNPKLKESARKLRNNSTLGEIILWKKLKGEQFFGYDFHRQKPLLEYIVDFYCAELNLIIEIDGQYHEHSDNYNKDVKRQQDLEKYDLHFLRFTEKEMKLQLQNVLRAIEIYITEIIPGNIQGTEELADWNTFEFIRDVLGRNIAQLVSANEWHTPGVYEITVDTKQYNLANGIYFIKMTTSEFTEVIKLVKDKE